MLVDRTSWGGDGTGPTAKGFTHVLLVDANTGGTSRQITSGDYTDTLLVRMPDEFHGWRRHTHQVAQQLYLQAWFEKYRTKASKDAVPALP